MQFQSFLIDALEKRRTLNTLRSLTTTHHLIDFTSNDYLGFASSPALQTDILNAFMSTRTTVGATGSRLLTGHSQQYEDLEQKIADYHGMESSLIFNTGYTANLGLLYALATPQDRVLHDIHIHASIYDGIRLSKAKSFPFKHNNMQHLQQRLAVPYSGRTFVCVESVYSLHGSLAPLDTICELCETYSAALIVDEAHAVGVFGEQGEGLVSSLGLQDRVLATLYTFSKALGTHGAAIAGSALLKEYLINFCRPFIYTTAQPAHALTAIDIAYTHNKRASSHRKYLTHLIDYFRKQACDQHIQLLKDNAATPIQSICVCGSARVRNIANKLQQEGYNVRPIVSPTVKQKQELLRICLHTFNTETEIQQLFNILTQVL
ncbi:aminotransferase class I/II-fold pyridoxal phosphate-dependent enzyme [Candidatus Chlamydia sanziniae]|uniref:8-amino-7-oxononanoate synthase n=1 Tax=Candidatus Chlamydia sanziniae TaxID=1806891 RepID=A0A1A9HVH8_9CHLA|nr:pyridoxal phosphate-dependent aminotransferase family protein [Candidatus Chlamydia sanziniae]ANH78835.1 8-amino-7-oxononanoate synthase [Candidatus Chlamydia sanziniae]